MSAATYADVVRWRRQLASCLRLRALLRVECDVSKAARHEVNVAVGLAESELRRAEHEHRVALDAELRSADGAVVRAALDLLKAEEMH